MGPRTLKRRPRRLWLMLPALLMSLELSKSMPLLKKRPSALLSLKLLSLNNAWLKLMRLLLRVDVLPWLNLSPASGNWKLSLAAAKAKTGETFKGFKRLSAVSRSSNSNKMKITRIKIVCLNLLASFNKRSRPTRSKLRKLKKLLLLTWPNIARPNKSLKRLRSAPNWLEMLSLLPVQPPLVSKLKEFKDFAPLSSSSKHQRPTNKFLGTTGSQDVPRAIVDSVWQPKYKQEQLQGLNLQKCPIEHHVLNCTFFSCLNMKYKACKQ